MEVVLFDGLCNFCNGTVNWLLRHDRKGMLRFAALQSEAGQQQLRAYGLPVSEAPGSFVFIRGEKAYRRSTAALMLIPYLPWWLQPARGLWIVPRPFRDAVYDLIARNRYRWFGKRETCMIPTPEQRARFL